MKYILEFFFVFFILISYASCKNFFYIDVKANQAEQNISFKKNIFNNYKFIINDTFSFEGSLISTLLPNLSPTYFNNNTTQPPIDDSNNKLNHEKTIEQNLSANNSITMSANSVQQQQKLTSTAKPTSDNITGTQTNESGSISDNLVSLLSGIIIESIHNGNPTINNKSNSVDSTTKNNNNIILASGKWKLDVQNGNITNFATKFVMITSNGTGIHWYSMNNFQSKEKLFLGNDGSAAINGKLDFFTANNTTRKTVDVLLSINNLELIQLTLLDKEIAGLFQEYPIYGTIDSIKIKN